jgi:hypothetical protein
MRSCLSKGSRPVGSGQRKREFVRWFSDGERGYAQELWKLASVRLKYQEVSAQYGHLKVWREGLRLPSRSKVPKADRESSRSNPNILSPPSVLPVRCMPTTMKPSIVRLDDAVAPIVAARITMQNSEGVTAGDHGTAVDSQLIRPDWGWTKEPPQQWQWAFVNVQ